MEAGARTVSLFSRSAFPDVDLFFALWRGRDDGRTFPDEAGSPAADWLDPLLAYNAGLGDADRLDLLQSLFRHGRSPANAEYLTRVRHLDQMTVHEEHPVDRIEQGDGRLLLHAKGGEFACDHVIFATGFHSGLEHCRELAGLSERILTWADVVPSSGPLVLDLDRYPKLSPAFQLQGRRDEDAYLGHVYSLADPIHITVGLQSLAPVVQTVAEHIGRSLYQEQHERNVAFIDDVHA